METILEQEIERQEMNRGKNKKSNRLSGKIMVIEDDMLMRPLLLGFLTDHEVLLANSGEEALDMFEKKIKVDVVICDYHMRKYNGVETIQRIRKISPKTKFILMSGSEPGELSNLALQANADAWLNKPFSEEILNQQVKALLALEVPAAV